MNINNFFFIIWFIHLPKSAPPNDSVVKHFIHHELESV